LKKCEKNLNIVFDIGIRNEINDLKSNCIYISKNKARELAEWILEI